MLCTDVLILSYTQQQQACIYACMDPHLQQYPGAQTAIVGPHIPAIYAGGMAGTSDIRPVQLLSFPLYPH